MAVEKFSGDEINTLSDFHYLLKIKHIQKKMLEGLAELREQPKLVWYQHFPDLYPGTGKISRGSNYKDLPYLILDYPNIFSQSEVLACRTMIWWGHDISCTLHLQGNILEKKRRLLRNRIKQLQASHWDICINDSPWEYHFGPDNYIPLQKIPEADLINLLEKKDFIKIASRISIEQINQLNVFGLKTFTAFTELLLPE